MNDLIHTIWRISKYAPFGFLFYVQNRVARFVTARFVTGNNSYKNGSMTDILEHLKRESLKKRRRDNRIILLYKPVYQEMTFFPMVYC